MLQPEEDRLPVLLGDTELELLADRLPLLQLVTEELGLLLWLLLPEAQPVETGVAI